MCQKSKEKQLYTSNNEEITFQISDHMNWLMLHAICLKDGAQILYVPLSDTKKFSLKEIF
jgi:hypothetical protein